MIHQLKYRNLYGKVDPYHYEGINFSQQPTESTSLKGNSKYSAFPWQTQGGGIICVLQNNKPRKIDLTIPKIIGHKGDVLDFDFCPFNDDTLATACDDRIVRIWKIPEDFSKDLIEPDCKFNGHQKKITHIQFNPIASNILATTGQDLSIKIWNLQSEKEVLSMNINDAILPYSLTWNYNGQLLGSTWKDKNLRIIDVRAKQEVFKTQGHTGVRSSKFCWMGNQNYYATTGTTDSGKRQLLLWDSRTNTVVKNNDFDSSLTVLNPHYDSQLQIMYLAGKGDGIVRYLEFINGQFNFINEFRDGKTGKAYGFFEKNCVDTSKNEIQKVIRISESKLEYISFIQPRKGDYFQDDLYPDLPAQYPQLQQDDWLAGQNAEPKLVKMQHSGMCLQNLDIQRKKTTSVDMTQERSQRLSMNSLQNQQIIDILKLELSKLQQEEKEKDQLIEKLSLQYCEQDGIIKSLKK